jgi:outer membrane lipoprotein-sorting protein
LFHKLILFIIVIFNFNYQNTFADNKERIIDRLDQINNIKFNFTQKTNEKTTDGICILVFNNKIRCDYNDSKQKTIIIDSKSLIVFQRRYNKKYYYPVSKSPFIKILNKGDLVNIVRVSDILKSEKNIYINYVDTNNQKITIFFDINTFDLLGWEMQDQFQNQINFSINKILINQSVAPEIFKIDKNF